MQKRFDKKNLIVIAALVLLVVVGIGSAIGYLSYRYTDTSRSADYTDKQRVEANKGMAQLVLDKTDNWDDETVVCVVDSAYRPMFENETDYTVAVYVLDKEAFAAGQAAEAAKDKVYDMDKLNSRDLYDVFLSGSRSLLTIENPGAATDRELIVFRDSFGSSMIPLLIADYKTVTVVDIRYVSSNFLDQLVDFHGQDVLFLYSTSVLNNSSTLK